MNPVAAKAIELRDSLRSAKAALEAAPAPSLLTPEAHNEWLRSEALKDILGAGLTAGAVGVGARALLGRSYLFGRKKERPKDYVNPDEVPVYQPAKAAGEGQGGGLWDTATNFLSGGMAKAKHEIPWYLPGVAAATMGSAYLGHKLTDNVLNANRKRDLQEEVDDAREEFRQSLLSNFKPTPGASPERLGRLKAAADLGEALDRLADAVGVTDDTGLEKAADLGGMAGTVLGMVGGVSVPLALLSGLASYKYVKARSTDELLAKAVERRQRERAMRRPMDVQAVPVDVPPE